MYSLFLLLIISIKGGEIILGPYDSCRLIHLNLASFVVNPFTEESYFDFDLFNKVVSKAIRLADDIVDLEINQVNKILSKIGDNDESETRLWTRFKEVGEKGRRAGLGFTALADTIAMLGYKFGSDESIDIIEQIVRAKFKSELETEIMMAQERGTFPDYNIENEWCNQWFDFIESEFPELAKAMKKYGRRNLSWSTVAPTGTVSILCNSCSSGVEAVFMPYYERRRKCSNPEDRVDYTDIKGINYTTFLVVHSNLKKWAKITHPELDIDKLKLSDWNSLFKESPYYGATANEIDPIQRVKIQGICQKYTTHSISSTINLPSTATEKNVGEIYINAWKYGNKGNTLYRDSCREGVMNAVNKPTKIEQTGAPKRPKVLEADYYESKIKGEQFIVMVGLLEGKPYEIFTIRSFGNWNNGQHKGTITKVSKMHYRFDSDKVHIDDLKPETENIEETAATLYSSMLLRHGVDIEYIIKTAKKVNDNIASFSSAMCRVLAKYTKPRVTDEVCPECGAKGLIRTGGCLSCPNCLWSRCD